MVSIFVVIEDNLGENGRKEITAVVSQSALHPSSRLSLEFAS